MGSFSLDYRPTNLSILTRITANTKPALCRKTGLEYEGTMLTEAKLL